MIENAQVIDRAWPVPKTLTREAHADELLRDNLYRTWDWFREELPENKADMLGAVINIAFRDPSLTTEAERMTEIRSYITGYVESWAERKVEEEE